MTNHYQIHDFLSVSVVSEAADIREGYDHYFRHFKVEEQRPLAKRYMVRDFSEFKRPDAYRQDGPYLSFPSGFCAPKQNYAIIFSDEGVEEYTAVANRSTNLWVQTLLVPQEVSLVHGAGVALGGKGILFAGFGGVGKTLLVSELRKRDDFMFFGDDYVMVGGQAQMYSYPTDFSIYPYHRAAFPELRGTPFEHYLIRRKMFGPWYEFQRGVNFISRRVRDSGEPIFSGWNAPCVKVPSAFLVPREKIGSSAHLGAVMFLSRYNGEEVKVKEVSTEELVSALSGNLLIEFQHALPYLGALNVFGFFDAADFLARQRAILVQCISGIKRYRAAIPLKMDSHAANASIIDHVTRLL